MPRGKFLTNEQRKEIYEAYQLGERSRDIAEAYGVTEQCVTRTVRKQRELLAKEADMAYRECVVAGDKKNGRLVSTSDPHRFEGTCVIGGKANSKAFTAANASAAAELWKSWCSELRDKQPKSEPAKEVATKPIEKREVKLTNENIYVIWTRGSAPRLFGAYTSMDAALKEVDNLNEVASFLVNDKVFEVEEITLKA